MTGLQSFLELQTLSLKAKALYLYMHGKPKGHPLTVETMTKELQEGFKSINTILLELKVNNLVKFNNYTKNGSDFIVLEGHL